VGTRAGVESRHRADAERKQEITRSFVQKTRQNAGRTLYEWTGMPDAAAVLKLHHPNEGIHIQCMLDCVYGGSYREMKRLA
jgi:hypothetical protein